MGNSDDTSVINPHLSKLFSGIERIKIQGPDTKKKDDFKYVKFVYDSAVEGEEMELDNKVPVTTMVETWLNDLEKAMINTLERKVSDAYLLYYKSQSSSHYTLEIEKNTSSNELLRSLREKFSNGQVYLIMCQYIWRKKIEADLIEASKNEKKIIDWENYHAAELSKAVVKATEIIISIEKNKDKMKFEP